MPKQLGPEPMSRSEISKRYRERHPKKARAATKAYYEKNKHVSRAANKKWYYDNPERKLLYLARSRARKGDLAFNLTLEDVKIPAKCPVLGIPLVSGGHGGGFNDNSPTVDRWKNDKGYVAGNVHVISWRANRIKCDATEDEILHLARYMVHGVPK